MAEASHAVFLSYASQDAEAAQKIAEALRAGGIAVFLDQSELRGGDAWDQADAETVLAKFKAALGDASAYQYAEIYAQWGNTPKALEWLDTAMRLRAPGLIYLKTDRLMDPLRKEPRFQAIERELKFPN